MARQHRDPVLADHLGRAERRVRARRGAHLTGALFVVVLAPLFIHDEPLRVNGIIGSSSVRRCRRAHEPRVHRTGRTSQRSRAHGSSVSYAVARCTPAKRRGVAADGAGVFQVTFAMLITGAIAVLLSTVGRSSALGSVVAILWLGLLGSGLAYLAFFRLLGRWGATRTSLVAYVLRSSGCVGVPLLGSDRRSNAGGDRAHHRAACPGDSRFGRQLIFERLSEPGARGGSPPRARAVARSLGNLTAGPPRGPGKRSGSAGRPAHSGKRAEHDTAVLSFERVARADDSRICPRGRRATGRC